MRTRRLATRWACLALWVGAVLVAGGPALGAEPEGMVLKWPDRRPIGQLFVSQQANVTKDNPDGYLSKDVNTRKPEGKAAFRKRLLESADKWIRVMKDTGGQGMIVWDLEGFQQASMVYVGDPRVLPEYAPAMSEVADEFFRRFLDAGLRTGLTIRPNKIFLIPPEGVAKWGKWGYLLYEQGTDDVVKELSERIAYAKKRWGCTLFYMDTNGYDEVVDGKKKHVRLPTAMMKKLNELHPEVLIIPEHPNPGYHAYTGQYREVRGGWTGTPAAEREKYPGAFSVVQVAGMSQGDLETRWDPVAESVMHGDVLFFFGWWPSSLNDSVRYIYRQAEYMKHKAPAAGDPEALVKLLKDNSPAVRFGAARALGEANAG
ncbi:MAG TPA: HEAT repeat domain-containing protein, partial [Phycisphaerae bacterium]|nr:HEAT repeat domain-containing protein [Phycisphaerae bacterium]